MSLDDSSRSNAKVHLAIQGHALDGYDGKSSNVALVRSKLVAVEHQDKNAMSNFNPLFGETLTDKVHQLIEKDAMFKKFFPSEESMGRINPTPEENEAAAQIFQEMFPDENFENFLQDFDAARRGQDSERVHEVSFDSPLCKGKGTYDPLKRGYVQVVGPRKRHQREEFDVFKFIRRKEEERDSYKMSIDQQCGDDGFLDVAFEDKRINDLVADQSLRKIARIVHILSEKHGYALLSCHSERRIK